MIFFTWSIVTNILIIMTYMLCSVVRELLYWTVLSRNITILNVVIQNLGQSQTFIIWDTFFIFCISALRYSKKYMYFLRYNNYTVYTIAHCSIVHCSIVHCRWMFYTWALLYGVLCLWRKPWFTNIHHCWIDYPFHQVQKYICH